MHATGKAFSRQNCMKLEFKSFIYNLKFILQIYIPNMCFIFNFIFSNEGLTFRFPEYYSCGWN